MVAATKVTVFGHVMRCNFIDQYHSFSSACYLHLQIKARSNSCVPLVAK